MNQVDICNLALSHIGCTQITALDDGSGEAEALNQVYSQVREELLRMHDWAFARRTPALAELEEITVPGWSFVYAYPASCLNLLRIYNDDTLESTLSEPYEKMTHPTDDSLIIASNCENAYCKFTYNCINENLFDTSFCVAFSWKLAAEIAPKLIGDRAKKLDCMGEFIRTLGNAETTNKNEGYRQIQSASDLVDGR